jgi:hypothetical protein
MIKPLTPQFRSDILENLNKQLEELDKWAASIDDSPVRNKGHWKEWCMRDEEDNRQ